MLSSFISAILYPFIPYHSVTTGSVYIVYRVRANEPELQDHAFE